MNEAADFCVFWMENLIPPPGYRRRYPTTCSFTLLRNAFQIQRPKTWFQPWFIKIEMKASTKTQNLKFGKQFCLRTLLLVTLGLAFFLQFSPVVVSQMFQRQPELPGAWIQDKDNIQYADTAPKFSLALEATALKRSRQAGLESR